MNKADFTGAVAAHCDVDAKIVARVLDGMEDVIAATVKKGEKVIITGLLSVERVDRKARKGRNPATGESIRIKASKGVRVSPGLRLRKLINGEVPTAKLKKAVTLKKAATRPAKALSATPAKTAAKPVVAKPSTSKPPTPRVAKSPAVVKTAPAPAAKTASPTVAKRPGRPAKPSAPRVAKAAATASANATKTVANGRATKTGAPAKRPSRV